LRAFEDLDGKGYAYSHSMNFAFEEVIENTNHKISEEPNSQNKDNKEINENEKDERHPSND